MGIHFNNSIGNPILYPVSRESLETDSTMKKGGESGPFLDFLKKVSTSPGQHSPQDPSQSVLKTQEALALYQKMELQMNESLLRILSDTEEENRFENPLIQDPMDSFKGINGGGFLSTIGQGASKNDLPLIQVPESILEKTKETIPQGPDPHGIDSIIRKAAMAFGVDPDLIRGVIQAESNFNPNAISPKGAVGLMQLMPETAEELGVTNPLDPTENIMGGTQYLKKLLDHYDGNEPLALAAYNWGMGNMDSDPSKMPLETRNYVARITGFEFA